MKLRTLEYSNPSVPEMRVGDTFTYGGALWMRVNLPDTINEGHAVVIALVDPSHRYCSHRRLGEFGQFGNDDQTTQYQGPLNLIPE